MNEIPIVEFLNVTFSYAESPLLFQSISLKIIHGAFYLIKGPSGAGKSSLLRLINRLEEPSAGEILFETRPLSSYHPPVLRKSILYIQQTPVAIDGSVRDNLVLPFTFKGNKGIDCPNDDELSVFLDDFHLNSVSLNQHAKNLSVGQLQRICLIRGLLLSPKIILMDEPTSALDKESRSVVESRVEKLCQEEGRTVIMVSHGDFKPTQIKPHVLEVRAAEIKFRTQ